MSENGHERLQVSRGSCGDYSCGCTALDRQPLAQTLQEKAPVRS